MNYHDGCKIQTVLAITKVRRALPWQRQSQPDEESVVLKRVKIFHQRHTVYFHLG